MPRRLAFTLIELLVVIAIIATLAGLLIPAMGMAKNMMNDVKCSHNMSQLGVAIHAWQESHDDAWPGHLKDLFDPTKSDLQLKGVERLMLCPKDNQKGLDQNMGRAAVPVMNPDLSYLWESGCSFLYESSSELLRAADNDIDYFYRDRPSTQADATAQGYTGPLKPTYTSTGPTWADAKKNSQRFGNLQSGRTYSGNSTPFYFFGDPYPPDYFPVIRCYHHIKWNAANVIVEKKVNNLSWNNNVFKSRPYWEPDVNPDIK